MGKTILFYIILSLFLSLALPLFSFHSLCMYVFINHSLFLSLSFSLSLSLSVWLHHSFSLSLSLLSSLALSLSLSFSLSVCLHRYFPLFSLSIFSLYHPFFLLLTLSFRITKNLGIKFFLTQKRLRVHCLTFWCAWCLKCIFTLCARQLTSVSFM